MTSTEVEKFLAQTCNDAQRADCYRLITIMEQATGHAPKLWGQMIGFGQYHYKYKSGREGHFFLTGFAPRKGKISVHLLSGTECHQQQINQLGKFKTGVSCLYLPNLSGLDAELLSAIITESVGRVRAMYPNSN